MKKGKWLGKYFPHGAFGASIPHPWYTWSPFHDLYFWREKLPKQGPNFQSKQGAHVGSKYTGIWCGFRIVLRIVVSCLIYESWIYLLLWPPEKHSSPFPLYDMPTKNVVEPLQGGPLPCINGFTTPISRVTFTVTHLFSAIYRGPKPPWRGFGPTDRNSWNFQQPFGSHATCRFSDGFCIVPLQQDFAQLVQNRESEERATRLFLLKGNKYMCPGTYMNVWMTLVLVGILALFPSIVEGHGGSISIVKLPSSKSTVSSLSIGLNDPIKGSRMVFESHQFSRVKMSVSGLYHPKVDRKCLQLAGLQRLGQLQGTPFWIQQNEWSFVWHG